MKNDTNWLVVKKLQDVSYPNVKIEHEPENGLRSSLFK